MPTSDKETSKNDIAQHKFNCLCTYLQGVDRDTIKNIVQASVDIIWSKFKLKDKQFMIDSIMHNQDLEDQAKQNIIDFFAERILTNICFIINNDKIYDLERFSVKNNTLLLDDNKIMRWSCYGYQNIFPPYQPYFTKDQDGKIYNMSIQTSSGIYDDAMTTAACQSPKKQEIMSEYCKPISIVIGAYLCDEVISSIFHTSKESEKNLPNDKNNKIEAVSFLYTDKKNNICKLYKVSFTEKNTINIQFIPFGKGKKINSLVTNEEKQKFKELFFSYSKDKPPFMENIEHEFNDEQRNFFDKIKDALGIEQIQNKHTKNDANNNSLNTNDDKKDKFFLNNKNNEENKRINDTGNQIGNNTQYVYDKTIIENKNDKTGNDNSPPCTLCGRDLSCLDCCYIFSGKQQ